MNDLTHEDAAAELAGVVLGSATSSQADRVRAHARGCGGCRAEMAQLEATISQLGELIPEHPINPGRAAGIRSRLVSRASADTDRRAVTVATSAASRIKPPSTVKSAPGPTAHVRDVPTDRPGKSGLRTGVMAGVTGIAVLFAAGAVIQMWRANSEANSLRATIQVQRDAVAPDPRPVATPGVGQDKIVAAVTGTDVKIITLTHYGARGAVAKMFWNRETNTWTLVTYSIRQPKPNKVFQVWLSTSSGTVSVGTFVPDARGRALVQGSNAVGRDGLYSISVTEEARGGALTPSGPAVIAGAP